MLLSCRAVSRLTEGLKAAHIISLKVCLLFALVPTYALMPCPSMMFVYGGSCVSIELRIVLIFSNSMVSTGWYIKHNVLSSSPLIFFPLLYVWEGKWHTNEHFFEIFAVSILIILFLLFLCAWLKVGDRMMHTPPITLPLMFVFTELP
jgi:hypothetical protein